MLRCRWMCWFGCAALSRQRIEAQGIDPMPGGQVALGKPSVERSARHLGVASLARAAWSAEAETVAVWSLVVVIWLLSIASYSPTERAVAPLSLSTLDPMAAAKVATRLIALLLLGTILWKVPRTPAKQHVLRRLLPFGLLAGWCMLSALWSPMAAVSLGHAGETLMFTGLAAVVGLVCTEDRHLSRILFHLTAAALVVSVLNAGFGAAGLSNAEGEAGGRAFGFLHPNMAAQVAGVGLVVLVSSYLIAGWRWTRWLLLPAIAMQGWVLFLSQSRTANGATFAALLACLVLFARRGSVLLVAVIFAVALTGYLAFDPTGQAFGDVQGRIVNYVMRGQTRSQFMTATGRTEMWAVGWQSFLESPLRGHGNCVMTKTGMVPVWGESEWQTAHNLFLHVLAGTGLIGGLLLVWALWRPAAAAWHEFAKGAAERKTAAFVLTVFGWFLLVGLYEISFLGPVSPSSLAFFVVLGIAAGRLP